MSKGLADLMKQAQKLQARMAEMQEELGTKTVEATSGGGMVTVVVTGKQQLVSITIDREVVDPGEIEMLQDLIVAAVNEGMRRSQDMVSEEMKKITGGLSIPGLV